MREELLLYLESLINEIPHGVYEGLLFTLFLGIILFIAVKGKKSKQGVIVLILMEYIFLVYCSTVLFRDVAVYRTYNYTPFWSYNQPEFLTENLMNILLFIPIGFLLGNTIRDAKWWIILLLGAGLSFSIELLQLVFKRGFSEMDDIIHNTLGCLIGYVAYLFVKVVLSKIFKGMGDFCGYLFSPHWGRHKKEYGCQPSDIR